jgi:Mrp family chromosome partitioning ATPase
MPFYHRAETMDGMEPIKKQRVWPLLWREKWIIAASIVVMVGLAIAYTVTSSKVYQASGLIQVNLATPNPGSSDTTAANQALAQNYATLLTSAGFLNQIRSQVDGGRLSVDELQSRLSATAVPQSALVELQATGASPEEAQRVDTDVANGFLANLRNGATTRTAQLTSQLQQQITQLSNQISALRAKGSTSAISEEISSLQSSRQALIAQNATLVANGIANGTSAALSAAPEASSSPISPKKTLNLLGGLLLGIVLGVAAAFARQALRPAIHSADDVAGVLDLPLLASIPLRSRLKADDPTLPEAYGVLHANLSLALRSGDMRVVTFVGYNAQVGKTSTVEGLARAAQRGERQILAVDGDMRLATLSTRFGHADHPGIVDVLQGAVPLDAALVQLESGLWLLPARPSRMNAASLLSGSRTYALMAELRERFDMVLIDSPPLSGLADGLILASHSDAVVLVVRAGLTKPADLHAANSSLLHNMTPVVGTVVFEELPVEPYYGAPEDGKLRSPAPVR